MKRKRASKQAGPFRLLHGQVESLIEAAVASAIEEVCGLLIDNGCLIELMPMKNVSRSPCSFLLPRKQVKRAREAAPLIGHRIVGTYHSHPLSEAVPGETDIDGAISGELMLIVSCWKQDARLWAIRRGKATEVPFTLIEG